MSKVANISIHYYSGTLDKFRLYKRIIFDQRVNVHIEDNQLPFMVDYVPNFHILNEGEEIKNVLLSMIDENNDDPFTFTLIYLNEIITVHTLNELSRNVINIAISFPRMLEALLVPDFSHYAKIILPHFDGRYIKSVEFSYG